QNLPQIDSYDLKIKCYNNGVYKVCWYKNLRKKSNTNLTLKFNLEKRLKMSKKELEELEEEQRKSYIFEVKNLIKDYVLCNHFDMFWTLTFDPKKYNGEVSDELAYELMRKWLNKMRTAHYRKSDNPFNYIAIPERHKSGQIHWHMLTGYIEPNLVDSGKTFRNQKIYNCSDWKHGFTNVQKMRSKSKVSSYMTKYITKDLLYSPVRKYKRKYWCSKGLALPDVYAGSYADLVNIFPLYDENGELKPTHSNDICDIWLFKV
ncbi:rolling circle replication-associated protein, partial [Staphylococcus aureus]